MKLNTPRWWYTRDARHGAIARTLLKPLSWIWAAATARRIKRLVHAEALPDVAQALRREEEP